MEQYEKEQQARQKLVEDWKTLIDIDDKLAPVVEGNEKRANLAQLLENQEKWVNEAVATSAGDIAAFTPILVPTTRRIMPSLVANELVGVQPMSMPTGYAYAWRVGYGGNYSANGGVNDNLVAPLNRTSSASAFAPASVILTFATGLTPVATELASGVIPSGGIDVRDTTGGGGNVHGTVVYAERTGGVDKILVELALTGTQPTAAVAFPITAGSNVYFDGTSATNTNAYAVSDVITNELLFNAVLTNYTGPHTTAAGEALGENTMASIRTSMERASVEATTRKLKAEFTIEMAQDLKAVHGMDAEAELMNILQYEIAGEIDRDIINKINENATSTTNWLYGTSASGVAVLNVAGTADGQWEQERFRTLYTKVVKEANRIATTTKRGSGNYLLASPNVVTALSGLNNFMYSGVAGNLSVGTAGVQKVGTLDGRFTVYNDTLAASDYGTVGYKGPGTMDAGIIYCPYIPVQIQKITHEYTFQPCIGAMTRDAILYSLNGTSNFYRTFAATFTGSQLVG